ncbi:MAG: excinuclease ABC subunit UvrA, partial [Pseudomonadota bacterium]
MQKDLKSRFAAIRITGARQNNLKGLSLEIPLNRLTVVTGVSGSGKSSLAFDTLYAEGQRRYVETFSPYARQFMERMDRPRVDSIENIPPAIAIDRKDPVRTSRSTVGTMTELTDYIKLLYGRMGQLHCRRCGRPVRPETTGHAWESLMKFPEGSEVIVTFPVPMEGMPPDQLKKSLGRMGYGRYFHGGKIEPIEQWEPAGQRQIHIVADRLLLRSGDRKRITDSLEQAFDAGEGRLDIRVMPDHHLAFSRLLECARCKIAYSPPLPGLFSFNSPVGACPTCRGFGRTIEIDLDLIMPDPSRSIEEGAIKPWGTREDPRMEYRDLIDHCRKEGIPTHAPFESLPEPMKTSIIQGTKDYYGIRGFFKWLESKAYKMHVRVYLSRYRNYKVCTECGGARFRPEALLYLLEGRHIGQVYALTIDKANLFFKTLKNSPEDKASRMILEDIRRRLKYLRDVGLGYLTLDRQSRTLSGGEVQRVALTSALGSSLVNALYVLDEPSIGLHPRDNRRLIRILEGLRDLQNTVVVVEHDPDIITHSDFILDMGPGAGERGGEISYFGPTARITGSLTGDYLRGKKVIPVPDKRRRPARGQWLTIEGAAEHNLKGERIRIPLGLLTCLTGVSGSGKSTLAEEILFKGIRREKGKVQERPGQFREIRGHEEIEDVILIDQRPIGRTPRANPITYTKAMDPIRKILADTEAARAKHLGPGHFSFNASSGQCATCKGVGFEKVEMQFLSDVFITCPECRGRRYKNEVLEVRYRGKNINDILSMTIQQALEFFHHHPKVLRALAPLSEVGLDYMRLGQPLSTLSSGEAQRLKLSQYMRTSDGRPGLFLFDEPTTGLHFEDVGRLLSALEKLVDSGNTVLVIEHNMDVIKASDWVIDLGPEGGDAGGYVVAAGTPEEIALHRESHTGRFLKKALSGGSHLKKNRGKLRPAAPALRDEITIKGAREHNLKALNLSIPRHQFVAVTGVSGSGKSTLIFDILFAEGQRRYLESLAPYVRQYVRILERPEVDQVSGLPPTVAIQQRISHAGRRSTVATLTEIYHFLRLLFSKLGRRHCPGCGRRLTALSEEEILTQVRDRFRNQKAAILAPKVSGRKGFHKDLLARALKDGYSTARIDGALTPLKKDLSLSRYHEHTIELLVGELPSTFPAPLIRQALDEGRGAL